MPKKADRNQALFTAAARACGLLVQSIHTVGQGCPDLIVSGGDNHGGANQTLLVELKCNDWIIPPTHPLWVNTLIGDEKSWHIEWREAPVIITNRLCWVLSWFDWSNGEIEDALTALAQDKGVKAALRRIERRDGCISAEIMATIEF